MMLQRFASTAFMMGALLTVSIPVAGLAQNRGRSEGGHASRSYAPRGSYGGSRYSGGQNFASPRGYEGRGYSGGRSYYGRGYVAPRVYERPVYRGYYRGGVYPGYGAPYYGRGYGYAYDPGYGYDPGYAYDPGYSYGTAPAPAPQACTQGSYDQYGNWVPSPNCYSGQPQYQQPPQNYDPNQQQYPQQNYDPNQPQRYNR